MRPHFVRFDRGIISRSFLLDNMATFYYSLDKMLQGVKIFSSDPIWRNILSELGAMVSDAPNAAYLDFDSLGLSYPATPIAIQTAIQNAIDGNIQLLQNIFGRAVQLPRVQAQIVILLHKTGGISASDLRVALGYSPTATTHALDTAIYQLRKTFGRDFIINENGIYKLGRV